MQIALAERLATAGCVRPRDEADVLVASARTEGELEAMVARREGGEPLEHIVGWAEFRGRRYVVGPAVFVPRARSELLVEEAASLVRCTSGAGRDVVVVDLCCGVGAVGGSLAAELPQVRLYATDVDLRSVEYAARNVAPLGGAVYQGDLFTALPRRLRRRVDVLVASPPYVPTEDFALLTAQARHFEPSRALDGGPDGLSLVDRIARGAAQWLTPAGCVALEVAERQLDRVERVLSDLGYAVRTVTSEPYGAAVVVGRRAC